MRIIAHAATTQGEGRFPQFERAEGGHAQVNRFRLNVQAVFGDSCGIARRDSFVDEVR